MKRFVVIILLLMTQFLSSMDHSIEMQLKYRPDDWISYSVTRNMAGIAISETHVYFATSGGILPYHIFREAWDRPFTMSDGLASNNIHMIAYDRQTGYLWCVNDQAVSYYSPGLEEWRNIPIDRLTGQHIYDLGIGNKSIWVDSRTQLIRINRNTAGTTRENKGEDVYDRVQWVRRGNESPNIDLLDYSLPYGYFFISDINSFKDIELREYGLRSMRKDDFSRLFVATYGLGAGFANLNTLNLEFKPHGSYIFDVRSMAWDESGMWMGGHPGYKEEGGISWWDMDQNEWQYFQAPFLSGLSSDHVNAIVADSDDVWFGTEYGLARYHKEKDVWRTFFVQNNLWGDQVLSLAKDGNTLWIGTDNGLNRMDLSSSTIFREKYTNMNLNPVYWIEPDDDYVWVGAEWGAYLYRKSTHKWQTVAGYPAIHETVVTSVSAWDGQVWLGTDDGVEMYDHATETWTGFTNMHFQIGKVLSVLADNEVVWVGTTDGLVKYVKEEERWHRYTIEDGLLHNTIQRILPDGDYIWLATPLGITRFFWNAPHRID